MRRVTASFAIGFGLLLVASCQPQRDSQVVHLLVWGVNLGPNDKGQTDVFREFERRNPGIKVDTLMMGSGGMNPQKLMTAIVGDVPPDVVYQDRFTLADWASRGAFRQLDDLIERDKKTDPLTPTPDQYFAATWEEATYEGKVYGVPWMADDRILVWNKDAFRARRAELVKAGLDPDRPPRTWSEVLAYSKALTEFNADGTLKRAGFIPNFGNAWFYMFAAQNEARLMSRDGRTCTLDNPESAEAMEFMAACYKILGGIENADRYQSTFRGESNDAFFTGQVAMKIDGDWSLAGIARYAPTLDFGAAPPPVPDDRFHRRGRFQSVKDIYTTWAGGFAYCIPRGARHAEAAWKFIKWVTSTEGRMMEVRRQDDLNRARGQMTFPRLTAQIATNEQSLREFLPKNPRLAAAVLWHFDLLPTAKVRPVSLASKVLWDESNRAGDNILRGTSTVHGALKEAQDSVQRVLDEHYQQERYPVADLRTLAIVGAGVLPSLCLGMWAVGRRRLGPMARKEATWGYAFVSPWVVGFLVFTLGPMLVSIVLSFTHYNVLQPAHWVGWKNYTDVVVADNALVTKAFANALTMAVVGVPLGIVTGLSLALLLNATNRGKAFFRTMFYLPTIVPGVATIVLWKWILSPDPKLGLLNAVWAATITPVFGVPGPGWLASEAWAKPGLILMSLAGASGGVIIWLAGLKGVPNELYEASSLDGANPWRQFWTVTLPQLSPLVFFNVVTGFIGSIQVFDSIYVSTGGYGAGPGDSLLVPVYHLFQNAFAYFRMGYASALAWVVFFVVMAFTAVQFWLGRHTVHYEVDD
ncbi:MAG: extracellular solute-binding protein [Armatimonadetes bacterium]|nr:extracellular solute-binding protein [Armatimonadota bacterium]